MKIAIRTPGAMTAMGPSHFGYVLLGVVACATAAATYAIAGEVTTPDASGAPPAVAAGPSTPAPAHQVRQTAGVAKQAAPPPAAEFARQFVGVTNEYAKTHGDRAQLSDADCVQASPGHYMCSYAVTTPSRPRECHIMQAVWTPDQTSTFTVTLSGRSDRCGSLREALRSLK